MNDTEHAFWELYIRHLADHLGLKDIQIELSRDTAPSDCFAMIHAYDDTNRAWIKVYHPEWFALKPWEQRQYLVHELLHLHLNPFYQDIGLYLDGKEVKEDAFLRKLAHRQVEKTVDTLSTTFSPCFLLPMEWFSAHSSTDEVKRYAEQRTFGRLAP